MCNVRGIVGIIFITALAAAAGPPADPADEQAIRDFDLGFIVGDCVTKGCEIFSGSILTDSTEPGHAVTVRVERWLMGRASSPAGETVGVHYRTETEPPGGAWSRAPVRQGAPVTVVFALGNSVFFKAGEAAIATSSKRDEGIIQSLADESARLGAEPGRMADLVVGLSQEENPALAGYILAELHFKGLFVEPEWAEDLLGQLILSQSFPAEGESEAVGSMVLHYFRLSDRGKEVVVQRLAQLSVLQAAPRAKEGFIGLANIFSFDEAAPALIAPDVVGELVKNYRAMVKSGSMLRSQDVEKGLKISF